MEDPRRTNGGHILHKLEDIIIIGLCTVVCGGEDFPDMEEFGKEREEWLRKFLELGGISFSEMNKRHCPNYSSIGCFGRITDVTNKTVDELKELRALGYNGLTFGVETDDNEALAFMNKGFWASDVLELCKKLEAAGISYNFFYLTGISGAGWGEIGAKASAELFNQLQPQIIESSMFCTHTRYNMVWDGLLSIKVTELPGALKRKGRKFKDRENKKCYGTSISDRP